MSRRARVPALACLLALLAGCAGERDAAVAPPPPPAKVDVAAVVARTVMEWDEFTGRTEAKETVEVRARVSGMLERVAFEEGAIVEAGAPLFALDPRPYAATLAVAEVELARAQARLALARSEEKRAARLLGARNIAEEEYERRQAEANAGEAEVQAARARVEQARLELSFTDIRAPIRGRISRAYVTPGNFIEGAKDAGTLLAILLSIDPLYVYYDVDERSVLKYRRLAREGKRPSARYGRLPARVGLISDEGFPIAGEVDYAEPRLDPGSGTVSVRAVLPNEDDQLSPGFFARVQVPGSSPYDATLVSERALQFDQGRRYVWVLGADDAAEQRFVELGPRIDGLRVVRSGLAAGERVVVNGLQRVRPGARVEPQEVPMPDDQGPSSVPPVMPGVTLAPPAGAER